MAWDPRAPAARPVVAGEYNPGQHVPADSNEAQPFPKLPAGRVAPTPQLPQSGPYPSPARAPVSPLAPYAALRGDQQGHNQLSLTTPPSRDWGKSSLGLDAPTAAAISYLGWWITALVVYFNERESRFVRFHALQAVVFTGALTVLSVLAYVASSLLQDLYLALHQTVWNTMSQGVALLAFVVVVFAWLTPVIAAFSGTVLRIPFIATYAERYSLPLDEGTQDASGHRL
jgi:uncharacterized membrane protein